MIAPNITYGENNIYYMIYIIICVQTYKRKEQRREYSIILKSEEYIAKTLRVYIYTSIIQIVFTFF